VRARRRAAGGVAALAAIAIAPAAQAAVRVSPVGVRPGATLTVNVSGKRPQTLSIDGRRVATATRATKRVKLTGVAQGRHRLRACRGRSCTSAVFVVTSGPILAGCPVLPPDSAWNTDISHAPLAADSERLVGAQAAGHDVHLDFGSSEREYGIPYAIVPASHCGASTDLSAPAYGSRWRLKASFDESPYRGPALAIVRALKRYGLMFADQGSAMFITGTSDRRWAQTFEDIDQRHPIAGDAFEVVTGAPVTNR
jgi:hypothetical protein